MRAARREPVGRQRQIVAVEVAAPGEAEEHGLGKPKRANIFSVPRYSRHKRKRMFKHHCIGTGCIVCALLISPITMKSFDETEAPKPCSIQFWCQPPNTHPYLPDESPERPPLQSISFHGSAYTTTVSS